MHYFQGKEGIVLDIVWTFCPFFGSLFKNAKAFADKAATWTNNRQPNKTQLLQLVHLYENPTQQKQNPVD